MNEMLDKIKRDIIRKVQDEYMGKDISSDKQKESFKKAVLDIITKEYTDDIKFDVIECDGKLIVKPYIEYTNIK